MKTVASSARPRPADAIRMYFQAASAAPSVFSIATSSAEITVVTSTAIHSSARLFILGAAVFDPDQQLEHDDGDQQVKQKRHLEDQRQPGGDNQRREGDAVLQRQE